MKNWIQKTLIISVLSLSFALQGMGQVNLEKAVNSEILAEFKAKKAAQKPKSNIQIPEQKPQFLIEENMGQWENEAIKFMARNKNISLRFLEDGISIDEKQDSINGFVWNMKFLNTKENTKLQPSKKHKARLNYALARFQKNNVPLYGELEYLNVYENISAKYYLNKKGMIEYDFKIAPNGNPAEIQMQLEGVENLKLDAKGNLFFMVNGTEREMKAPFTYQIIEGKKVEIPSAFVLDESNQSFGFKVGDYDTSKELIIDPMILSWGTLLDYIPQLSNEYIDMDENGNIVVAGYLSSTWATNPYTTPGSHQSSFSGGTGNDIIIAVINKDGNLVYATYYGGTSGDNASEIKIKNGRVVIVGNSGSDDLPGNVGPIALSSGNSIIFAAKFNSLGHLDYTSVFGNYSFFNTFTPNINVSNNGEILLTGHFISAFTNFSTTSNAIKSAAHGNWEAFVTLFDASGNQKMATYFSPSSNTGTDNSYVIGEILNNKVYLFAATGAPTSGSPLITTSDALLTAPIKDALSGSNIHSNYLAVYDMNFNQLYGSWLPTSTQDPVSFMPFNVDKNEQIYIGGSFPRGSLNGSAFPLVSNLNGSTDPSTTELLAMQLNPDYTVKYISRIADPNYTEHELSYSIGYNGKMSIMQTLVDANALPIIGGGEPFLPSEAELYFAHFNELGQVTFSSRIGSNGTSTIYNFVLDENTGDVYSNLGAFLNSNPPIFKNAIKPTTTETANEHYIFKFSSSDNEIKYATNTAGNNSTDLAFLPKGRVAFMLRADQANGKMSTTFNALYSITSPSVKHPQLVILDANGQKEYVSDLSDGTATESAGQPFYYAPEDKLITVIGSRVGNQYFTTSNGFDTNFDQEGANILCFEFCPDLGENTINGNQTICINGAIDTITGNELNASEGEILFDGNPYASPPQSGVAYNWQISSDGTNWTDLGISSRDLVYSNPITATTYFRRIIDDPCCEGIESISNTVTINVNANTAPSINKGGPYVVCPGGTANIDISLTGGIPTFNYLWSTGATTEDISAIVTSSSVFEVQVTDGNGCISKAEVSVAAIEANAGVLDTALICDERNGVRIGVPTIPGFSYSWSPTTGLSDPNVAQPIANPSSATDYTLTISGPSGCPDSDMIHVKPSNVIANAGPDIFVCQGTDIQIGSPALSGVTYGWNTGLYLTSQTTALTTFTSGVIPAPNPFEYIQTAFNAAAGCYDTDTMYAAIIVADADIDGCGPRYIGTPDVHYGNATYTWNVLSGDAGSFVTANNIPMPYVNPNVTTTYEVVVSWSGTTCRDTVVVPPCGCPNYGADFINAVGCGIGTQGTVIVPLVPNINDWDIEWAEVTPGGLSYLSCTTCATPTITSDLPSDFTYSFTYTNKLDGTAACTENITVYNSAAAMPIPHANGGVVCSGGNITIGQPPIAGWQYNWESSPSGFTSTQSDPSVSPTENTDYTLTATDPITGCVADSTITITVFDGSADVQESVSVCTGVTVTLTAVTPQAGYNYSWSPATGLSATNVAQPDITITADQTYTLIITDSGGSGCSSSHMINVTGENCSYDAPDICLCSGSSGIIGLPGESGYSYSWSPSTGLSDPNIAQPVVNISSTQVYTVTVTDPNGGQQTNNVTVTVKPLPTANAGPDIAYCSAAVMIGGAAPLPSHTYAWSPTSGLSDPNIAQPTVTTNQNRTYTLTVTGPDGCQAQDQVNVTVTAVADAGPDRIICAGDDVGIGMNPVSGVSYSWSPSTGLNNSSIANPDASPASTTVYTLTVSSGGCNYTDDVEVIVATAPTTPVMGNSVNLCEGGCATIGGTGTTGLTYQWLPATGVAYPTNPTTEVCPPNGLTQYRLFITDPLVGCTVEETVSINITGTAPVIDAGPDSIICNGNSIQIGSPAQAGIEYTWSPNAYMNNPFIAQPTVGPTNNITYELTAVETATGCVAKDEVNITVETCMTNDSGCGMEIEVQNVSACSYDPISTTSKTTLDVLVSWDDTNPITEQIRVVTGMDTAWIDATTIPSPRLIQMEIELLGLSIGNIKAEFETTTSCNAMDSYLMPMPCPCTPIETYVCPGEILDITAETGATGIQWYNQNGPIATATGATLSITNPGTYYYTATGADGCPIQMCCPLIAYACASLGDTVWRDGNANGLQDPGEIGISGVEVTLWDANTSMSINTTFTNSTGFYHFGSLRPGDYYVVFDHSTSTASYFVLTQDNQGSNDAIDSDADSNGRTHTTSLVAGEHDPTLDAGYIEGINIGDTVWHDLNRNGIQNTGEPGIAGVVVTLYDASTSTIIATTVTNSSGYYRFDNVIIGTYCILFNISTNTEGQTSYVVTPQNNPSQNPSNRTGNDSDIDTNEKTNNFAITPSEVALGDNWTIDAGYYLLPIVSYCPPSITINNDLDICGANVTYISPDIVTSPLTGAGFDLSSVLGSGSIFPVGTTTEYYLAQDISGNTSNFIISDYSVSTLDCEFTITVLDTQDPYLTCPANVNVENDLDRCGAVVTYLPMMWDNCPNASVAQTSPSGLVSGSEFPVGITPVVFTATDEAGNQTTCQFTIEVRDTQNPYLTCPASLTVPNDPGNCEAMVSFTPQYWDNCPGVVITESNDSGCPLLPGAIFAIGTTEFTYTATDAYSNTTTCSFTITVDDAEDPTITCPVDIITGTDPGLCSAVVNYTPPEGDDNCQNNIDQAQTLSQATMSGFMLAQSFTAGLSGDLTQIDVNVVMPETHGFLRLRIYNNGNMTGTPIHDQQFPVSGISSGINNLILNTPLPLCIGQQYAMSFSYTNGSQVRLRTCTSNCYSGGRILSFSSRDLYFQTHMGQGNIPNIAQTDATGLTSGDAFPLGTTTLEYTITDGYNNQAVCQFTITVVDNENPDLTCPANIITTTDANVCTAVVTFEPATSADNCSSIANITITQTSGLTSGSSFPLGTSNVTYEAADQSGNESTCSFVITVSDNEAPGLTCPANINVTNDAGLCTAMLTFNPTTDDNCTATGSINLVQTAGIPSGSNFPVGVSNITFEAEDQSGNESTCSFTITISDNEAPSLTCPANINVNNDAGLCTAQVNFTPTTEDNCTATGSINLVQTAGMPSGSNFPVGVSNITFEAEDQSGNESTCSFIITVSDNEAPSLTCPANINVNNDAGLCTAMLTFNPVTDDNCTATVSINLVQTAGMPSGSNFPVGVSNITFEAADQSGNESTCSFVITVSDNEAPGLTCPANINVTNDAGLCTAMLTFNPTMDDNCTATVSINLVQTAGMPSGSNFPVGVSNITFEAEDQAGNESTCSFVITVSDNEAPSLTCPANINVNNDAGLCTAQINFTPTTDDNCTATGSINLVQTAGMPSGSNFPVGVSNITFEATDQAGNESTCSFVITISDNEAPGLTCPANINVNNDAGLCTAMLTFNPVTDDNCTATASINLVQISGIPSGSNFPVGINNITFEAEDQAGNESTCSFVITVSDNENPSINCPASMTVNTGSGVCNSNVSFSNPVINDNCIGTTLVQTSGLPSGSSFPLGVNQITFEVTDGVNLKATCGFTITVKDNQAPSINCNANIVTNTDPGRCDAVVTYSTPTDMNNCPGLTVTRIAGPASGSIFPLGTTTIVFEAVDNASNRTTCSFTITVEDNEAPMISCPANINVNNDPGKCTAEVNYTITGTDNCPGATTSQVSGLGSGANFPVGTTVETYKVEDANGLSAQCSFNITVSDNENPFINCPPNIAQDTDLGTCDAIVTYLIPVAADNCPNPSVLIVSAMGNGSTFPTGTHTEIYQAVDASGNIATCSFEIVITDNQPPVWVGTGFGCGGTAMPCPSDMTVCNDLGGTTALVTYQEPCAVDNCPNPSTMLTSGLPSGGTFPAGITTNCYQGVDVSGNTIECCFEVYVKPTASLGDFVWEDKDGDGVQDPGETGIPGVVVELYDPITSTLIATTTTGPNGEYLFDNLPPGDYCVLFNQPAGFLPTAQDNAPDASDSDADPITGKTDPVTLTPGQHDPTIDAGFYRPASLGDYVWEDTDNDGEQESGENGIPNVVVELYDATTSTLIGTTLTGPNGEYIFTGLTPGDYCVRFDQTSLPAGYLPTVQDNAADNSDSDADPITGKSHITNLESGEHDPTLDAGFWQPASLGDYVWEDTDGDGVQDPGETGISGVVVELYDPITSTLIATTTTGPNGEYLFDNLPPGDYCVLFNPSSIPSGYTPTAQDNAPDGSDSDADPITGKTDPVTLTPGQHDPTIDAGFIPPLSSIGDFVWEDKDADGQQDPGEMGIPNVVVELYDATTSTLVGTTLTDGNGGYLFSGLPPGDYCLVFNQPAGYISSPSDQGADATDSDADETTGKTGVYTLVPNGHIPTVDAGYYQPASLGDYVWEDTDNDGEQEAGENGIANVVVELYDATTSTLVGTTLTGPNGEYIFTGLTPGDYCVRFDQTSLPSGFIPTVQDNAADNSDSDADPITGKSHITNLESGEHDPTLDAGFWQPASLGDYVWEDKDGDGVQDPGETGIPGVVVELYDPITSTLIATTTTGPNGEYIFDNLPPGDYCVLFNQPAGFLPTSQDNAPDASDSDADPITGKTDPITLTPGQHDPNVDAGFYRPASLGDYVWEDKDMDGQQEAGENGIPNVVVELYDATTSTLIGTTLTDGNGGYVFTDLPPGDYCVRFDQTSLPAGYLPTIQDNTADNSDSDADPITGKSHVTNLESGEHDPTLDAGFWQPASLGDFVWEDTDGDGVQDPGETGIPGVVVELYDPITSTLIATTTTGPNGEYLFDNLPPGDYCVLFNQPAGFLPVAQDNAPDGSDSDADPITGKTDPISLTPGQHDPNVDAGFYRPASLGDYVWEDKDMDGQQEAGENGIANVLVELYDATTSTLIGTTLTGPNGEYIFDNLPPGDYCVLFNQPSGFVPTVQDNTADNSDSDADAITGKTPPTNLESGEHDPTIDAGFYVPNIVPASLGDTVWYDINHNGIQDAGETGIANVVVELFDAATSVSQGTVQTDGNGFYLFAGLNPGTYCVVFHHNTAPAGYSPTLQNVGADTDDSDANPTTGKSHNVTLAAGQHDPSIDAGYWQPASLGDFVWEDVDGSSTQDAGEPGIGGVKVVLYDATTSTSIATTFTDGTGFYGFTDLEAGDYYVVFDNSTSTASDYLLAHQDVGSDDTADSDADKNTGRSHTVTLNPGDHNPTIDAGYCAPVAIGDYTWLDTNQNGIQDNGETPLPGVTVVLIDVTTNTFVDSRVTDANGYYLFEGLKPSQYQVQFIPPTGSNLTGSPQNMGIDTLDSDANPFSGYSPVYDLTQPGSVDTSVHAGFYTPVQPLAAVGNYIWQDTLQNGLQDPVEPVATGVLVELIDVNTSTVIATQTSYDGYYLFYGLTPGDDYQIRFTPPSGYVLTSSNQGGDDAIDSDADMNTGLTVVFSLAPGEYNPTFDVGIIESGLALPVEMEWDVQALDGMAYVNWSTFSERNNDRFEIERVRNLGDNPEYVGTRKGAGNSNQTLNYQLIDEEPFSGASYYRIVQFDFDGTRFETEWKKINIEAAAVDNLQVRVWPNPAKDLFYVAITGDDGPTSVILYDATGKVIMASQQEMQKGIEVVLTMDVSQFAAGQYTLKITQGENIVFKKVVVTD